MSNSANDGDTCCGGLLLILFIGGLVIYVMPVLLPIVVLFLIPIFIIYIVYVLLTGS